MLLEENLRVPEVLLDADGGRIALVGSRDEDQEGSLSGKDKDPWLDMT